MLRSTAQIRFNELYMERSTRKSEFFKRLNTSDSLGSEFKKK
ncbi:MAG: hypothetical protein ACMUEL_00940 [Flavobacteriales bacterium Tduv]